MEINQKMRYGVMAFALAGVALAAIGLHSPLHSVLHSMLDNNDNIVWGT